MCSASGGCSRSAWPGSAWCRCCARSPPASVCWSSVAHDWVGAGLTFFGLAGPVLALIRQPVVGWGSPQVWVPLIGGFALLGAFVYWEAHTPAPMLPLGLFKRRNFTIGNIETFTMYGGLG